MRGIINRRQVIVCRIAVNRLFNPRVFWPNLASFMIVNKEVPLNRKMMFWTQVARVKHCMVCTRFPQEGHCLVFGKTSGWLVQRFHGTPCVVLATQYLVSTGKVMRVCSHFLFSNYTHLLWWNTTQAGLPLTFLIYRSMWSAVTRVLVPKNKINALHWWYHDCHIFFCFLKNLSDNFWHHPCFLVLSFQFQLHDHLIFTLHARQEQTPRDGCFLKVDIDQQLLSRSGRSPRHCTTSAPALLCN